MTGFARTAFEADGAKFVWELKTVNARGLEIRSRLPAGFDHLDPEVRQVARERLTRGSCYFALQEESGPEQAHVSIDEVTLALVVAAARRLAAMEGFGTPTADGLLAIPGVLKERRAAAPDGAEDRDAAILEGLRAGLEALVANRREEGRRLHGVLQDQLAAIESLVASASALAAEAPDVLRARIRDQVALLAGEATALDPDRLHQEALLAATRVDVREELDRLTVHVAAVRELAGSGNAVGRRLEFLAQEFNREANTLCSKAFDVRLTAIGIELKAVVDQLREQAQNLE